MKRNLSFGAMALLNEEGAVVADGGLDIDQQHGDGADAALLEVQDTNAEVVANDAAVGELENTAIALESLLETAEASVETGGLDPLSAEILTKAVNNETAPLGTDAEEVVPALESFASSTDRRQSTVMAIESIKDWIEKVWAKIKELIAKGRELAKKLFIKVKQAIQGLERRVAGLKKDAEARNANAPKAGQVELSAAIARWEADEAGAKKASEALAFILDGYTDLAIKHAEKIATALNGGDEKKAAAEGETDKEGTEKQEKKEKEKKFAVPENIGDLTKLKGSLGGNEASTMGAAGILPGGYIVAFEPVGFSIQMRPTTERASQASFKGASKAMALDEIKKVLAVLEDAAKKVVEYERTFNKRDDAIRKVTEAGDKFAKEAKKADQKDEGDVRAAINAARNAATLLDRPIKSTLSYSATWINGTCSYLAAHLKQYDKK